MKVITALPKEPNTFPITLTLEITETEELFDLWHRTNFAHSRVEKLATDNGTEKAVRLPSGSNTVRLWIAVDKILTGMGERLDRTKKVEPEYDDEDEECDCPACVAGFDIFGRSESPKVKPSFEDRIASMERTVNELAKKMREAK